MNKLSCMQSFVSVAHSGNFSTSADQLSISKAYVSKQISQLEEHLGVRLLQRTTRQVSLTSNGQAYYEQCRSLLMELEELEESMRSRNAALSGQLRITGPGSFSELHLIPIISIYSMKYPEVRLKLEFTDKVLDLVEERIDIGIRIGLLNDSSLVARRLTNTTMMLCASLEFVRKEGGPKTLEEIHNFPCIVDENYPGGNHWSFESSQIVAVKGSIAVNSAQAARSIVLAGHGIGFLPSFVIGNDIKEGRLAHLLPHIQCESLDVFAIYPHRKHLSTKIRLFIDTAVDYFSEN